MLLLHGDSDTVVSPTFLLEAKVFLIRNKIEIKTNLIKNCEHHIPVEASSLSLNYIKNNFNI
jgi:phospholipase/carboxylesterase